MSVREWLDGGVAPAKGRRVSSAWPDPVRLYGPSGAVLDEAVGSKRVVPATLYGPDGAALIPSAAALADGAANPTAPRVGAALTVFNETTWDRLRGTTHTLIMASAARNSGATSAAQVNYNARGLLLIIDVTANPAGGETLLMSIHGRTLAGAPTGALHFRSIPATNAVYGMFVGPGFSDAVAAAANTKLAVGFPRNWHVYTLPSVTGTGHEWTFSVEAAMLV